MLHGCTQDPDDLARGTRITEHADRNGFLVLLAEQPASANVKKCWNWYDPGNQRRDAGEPALIAGMTRQVASEWAVDTQRVSLAGISAGAAMASVVAVAYPELFTAVGLHSGIPYGAATNVMEGVSAMKNGVADTRRLAQMAHDAMGSRARPIPVIIVQGAADPVVRPINAVHTRDLWLAMNALARGSGSAGSDTAGYRRVEAHVGGLDAITECHGRRLADGGCEVATLTVAGLGHAWSGGSKLGTFTDERGPDATDAIVRFLLAHHMPARPAAPNAMRP
jgi:poly(hydroxyalkanoate) depolymerase family esterase